ncbi:MAG TPA: hypothetical protein VHX65_14055 [Pirellulales bacterium]|jgi:hypothetical protein|nr:hypothetical protein [Pirellulales bacterium]
MAARENQGLQIALIVFVALTIGMVVSTYLFFSRWQEQVEKNKASVAATTAAITDKDKAVKERGDLMTLIGADPATAVPDEISAEKAKIASYASLGFANLPADQQTFDKVVTGLVATIKTANDTVESTKKTMAQQKTESAAALAKAKSDADEISTARDEAVKALGEERTKYNDAVAALNKEKDQLAADKNVLAKKADELKAGYEKKIAALGAQIAQLTKDNVNLKLALDRYNRPNPVVSGGRIVYVNQRDNMVFLNLGSEDVLQRKTTFNVYPEGTANVTNVVPKGRVEVTNITGPHTSEARIIENAINDPLLPGDLVHTIEWAPGQHPHYAIGGVIDLNGSGTDQTQKLREMIESTGGIVDAYVEDYKDSDGKLSARVKGAVNINTRYLILGDPKVETTEGAARLQPDNTLMTEADRLHVEKIGLNKFLTMMGYVPPAGVGPGAAGVTPRGTIKGAQNNAFQDSFRPRQPGAAAAAGAGATP